MDDAFQRLWQSKDRFVRLRALISRLTYEPGSVPAAVVLEAFDLLWSEEATATFDETVREARGALRRAVAKLRDGLWDAPRVPHLIARLTSPDASCRGAACELLGFVGGVEHIPLLEPLLDDPLPFVSDDARVAIRRLGFRR